MKKFLLREQIVQTATEVLVVIAGTLEIVTAVHQVRQRIRIAVQEVTQ